VLSYLRNVLIWLVRLCNVRETLQCPVCAGVDKDTEYDDLHSVTVFIACWSRQRQRNNLHTVTVFSACWSRQRQRNDLHTVTVFSACWSRQKTQHTNIFTPLQCSVRAGVDKRHSTQRSPLHYSVQCVLE